MDQFRNGSLTFDVRDSGPADGEPVVLLHGFPQNNHAWDQIEPILHEAGYRTLSPNQRGYSPGAQPKGRRAYTAHQLVGDVVALLDAAGLDSAHIVGHDWGAAVAWGIAGLEPERVKSLTAVSVGHPAAFLQSFTKSTQGLKSWYMLAFQIPALPEFLIGKANLENGLVKSGVPREFAKEYAARMSDPKTLTSAINWYRALPFSRNESQPRSAVPTTYIWGRSDPFLGRAAAETTAAFVTGPYRFAEVSGGHWLPETQPAEVAQLIIEQAQSASSTLNARADEASRN